MMYVGLGLGVAALLLQRIFGYSMCVCCCSPRKGLHMVVAAILDVVPVVHRMVVEGAPGTRETHQALLNDRTVAWLCSIIYCHWDLYLPPVHMAVHVLCWHVSAPVASSGHSSSRCHNKAWLAFFWGPPGLWHSACIVTHQQLLFAIQKQLFVTNSVAAYGIVTGLLLPLSRCV